MCRRCLSLFPNFVLARAIKGMLIFALGRHFEEISNYRKSFDCYWRVNEPSNIGTSYSVVTDLEKMKKLQMAFSKEGQRLSDSKKFEPRGTKRNRKIAYQFFGFGG
jgi:hypothetical protein